MIPLLKFIKSCMQIAQVIFTSTEHHISPCIILVNDGQEEYILEGLLFLPMHLLSVICMYMTVLFATKYTL